MNNSLQLGANPYNVGQTRVALLDITWPYLIAKVEVSHIFCLCSVDLRNWSA